MFVLTALTPPSYPAESWSCTHWGGGTHSPDPTARRGGCDGFVTPCPLPEDSWSLEGAVLWRGG